MELSAGIHTVQEILDLVGLEVDDSFDRRRIKISGLGFDYTDKPIRVVGESFDVTLDGEVFATVTVL